MVGNNWDVFTKQVLVEKHILEVSYTKIQKIHIPLSPPLLPSSSNAHVFPHKQYFHKKIDFEIGQYVNQNLPINKTYEINHCDKGNE